MRMTVRTEECRRRAAQCALKALSESDREIQQIYTDLAEQWRALAEQLEFLGQYPSPLTTAWPTGVDRVEE
jgi:hypothetical protein